MPEGCASEVVRLAKEAGIALTPAGAAFPGGHDPRDSHIRLAPSFPTVTDLEQAIAGLAVCVRLAAVTEADHVAGARAGRGDGRARAGSSA